MTADIVILLVRKQELFIVAWMSNLIISAANKLHAINRELVP